MVVAPASRALAAVRPAWALAALVAVSALLRFWGGTRIQGLWMMPDEGVYALIGRSLWDHGRFEILNGGTAIYSFVYPALAGLPLADPNLERGYVVLKAVQAVVMSLAAIPVYLWGRTMMRPRWALVAAVLSLSVPALLYTGFIMTEVAFYPAFTLAAWTLARALAEPTRRNAAFLVGAVALAAATRLQALVLVPAVLVALALHALLERNLATARRFLLPVGGIAALTAAWALWRLRDGGSWTRLLGAYAVAGEVDYSVGAAARWTAYHVADLLLATALFPVCALALLGWEALRRRERSATVRAYVATALALVVLVVLQVGVFASGGTYHILERDQIYLAPILFLAFAIWLDRGAPRPRIVTSAIALAALLVLAFLPLDLLTDRVALPDTFTSALVQEREVTEGLQLAVYGGAAAALAALVLLPRRLVVALPATAFVFLVVASIVATREVSGRVAWDQVNLLGGRRSWIDDSLASGRVAYLYGGESYWNGVWQHVFWNRRVDRVYYLDKPVPGPMPQRRVTPTPDGRLRVEGGGTADAAYAVASTRFDLRGDVRDELRQYYLDVIGHNLWQLHRPFRVGAQTLNLRPDGDMYEPARLVAYDCSGGQLLLTLLTKSSSFAELWLNGRLVRRVDFATEATGEGADRYWTGSVSAPPGMRRCVFEVRGNSLLGSTLFEFVRG